MKCPKCGYLGFEKAERCRNCGYDFSLALPSSSDPELSLRNDRALHAAEDLDLSDSAGPSRAAAAGLAARRPGGSASLTPGSIDELPLFGPSGRDDLDEEGRDDVPLITQPSPPRPPLAVRRATPEVPRLRAEASRTAHLEFPAGDPGASLETRRAPVRPDRSGLEAEAVAPAISDAAGMLPRLLASVIDLGLLGLVDLAVVYFTLQICGLSASEFSLLPLGPLVAFLIVQNGGYLVAFTAGGQTIGKMALGIRVVPAVAGTTLDLGRALIRTAVWGLLVLPAGLGLLTALWSDERRGLHDRCAGTRVVRATAS
jgi:uncharacterized RDD family membrane protein YckC